MLLFRTTNTNVSIILSYNYDLLNLNLSYCKCKYLAFLWDLSTLLYTSHINFFVYYFAFAYLLPGVTFTFTKCKLKSVKEWRNIIL